MIITILRKPLEGSVAENTLKHGCGAINIDDTRISTSDSLDGGAYAENPTARKGKDMWTSSRKGDLNCFRRGGAGDYEQPSGRWPANFILIHKEYCELKGTKKVKKGVGNSDKGGTEREVGLYKDGLKKRAKDHHQGEETIADWDCVEDCSIKALDQQSGVLRARGNIGTSKGGGGMFGHGFVSNNFGAGDKGGASRFFNQFKKESK